MGDMRRSGCGVGCAWSGAEGRARLAMRARVVVYSTRGASSGTRLVGSCLAECGVARDAGRGAAQARLPRSGTALVTRAGPCVAPRRGARSARKGVTQAPKGPSGTREAGVAGKTLQIWVNFRKLLLFVTSMLW